jgi:hypothetical protein
MNKQTMAGLIALAGGLVAAAGCSTSTDSTGASTHTLVSNLSEEVGPGACAPVEGPYAVPDGTSMDYTITDIDDTDSMDVGIIDDAFGCSFSSGYGVQANVASVTSGDDGLVAGNYDFVVHCRNFVTSCVFALSWSATY